MRPAVAFSVGAILVILESCGTQKGSIGTTTASSDQIHEVVRNNQTKMQTARGEGTISVETPSIAQSGSFVLSLKKPDSLLVILKGPFGIKVGSALFTRDNFLFYNSLENRLYSGVTSAENLAKVLRVDLGFDDLINLFSGGVFFRDDTGVPDETGVEDDQFTLVYRDDGKTHKYYIDPKSMLITKIEYLDIEGKLDFEQRFINFQDVDSALVPFNIRIIQPKERRMVSVVYSDLSFNPHDLEFTFPYPKNAQRVRWQ